MLNSLGLFFLNNVLDTQFLYDFYWKLWVRVKYNSECYYGL